MTDFERNKYLEAYYNNEADANKQMSIANAAAGIYMTVLWIFYLTGFFKIHSTVTLILINIIFPISILILLSPLLYAFKLKDRLRHPRYKYFVLFSFVLVIAGLNAILPKHTVISWALCIVMTNHYYNPKVGMAIFFTVLGLSLVSMYASMFVGEFDANLLLGNEVLEKASYTYADGPQGRFDMLNELLKNGTNRYLDAIIYYYLPRSVLLVIVFFVSNGLNKRTYKLLVSEIHVNSEQERTRTELEVAKDIQLNTLPSEISVSKEVEIVAELKAAKEVGGDFYDYFEIDDEHTAVVIGDVSGKGIPAAMFMMKTITCFKNFVRKNKTPAEILKEVNASIYDENSQMFVTCFLAILNKNTGRLQFANAGHNPPIIGNNRSYHFLKCNPGFVLGGFEEAFVKDEETVLKNGESLTLYTDGITEARNEKGEFFGEQRLIDSFNRREYTCLVELHHSIKDDVAAFVGQADQSDDLTFLTIKHHGDKYSYEEKYFDGKMNNVGSMLEFIEAFCDKNDIRKDFKNNLLVVGDELASNIVKYGYHDNGGVVFIRLLYNVDKQEFAMTLIDKADAFNPLEVNNEMVGDDADKQQIGGLGILIVKKIMSECAYDRINGKNILVLKKQF